MSVGICFLPRFLVSNFILCFFRFLIKIFVLFFAGLSPRMPPKTKYSKLFLSFVANAFSAYCDKTQIFVNFKSVMLLLYTFPYFFNFFAAFLPMFVNIIFSLPTILEICQYSIRHH